MNSTPLTQNANHADVDVWQGFSIRESAGSPDVASINFRKATSDGELVAVLELKADESATLILSKRKISVEGGLYVQVTAGSVEGVLFHN